MSFTVYKASAGSGKTFTLVKEYLKISLASDDARNFRHVLAITFTNKAAAEMKVRIITALKDLTEDSEAGISSSSKTLKEILLEELKLPPHLLHVRAQKTLESILHNYSDFAIGTIDSFVHRVVRTFAYDLHLPVNFEIELDADKLLIEAVDLLISKIGADEKLTKAMVEFTEEKADEEKSWHIERDLFAFAKNLLDENGRIHLEQLKEVSLDDFFEIRDKLFLKKKKYEDVVSSIAKKGWALIEKAGIAHAAFSQGKNGIGKYFENLASGRMEMIKPNSYVQKTLGEDKWHSTKAAPEEKSKIDSIKTGLTDLFLEIQLHAEKENSLYVLISLLYKNIYSLAVLNELEKLLEQFKTEEGILHISEFNNIISRIVLSQPVPFIYERLGIRFKNFLVDEFQDTSALQWQNLLPLIDNALAENNFNLVVGDSKQAIYRWRGGDAKQFSDLPEVNGSDKNELIKQRANALANHFSEKILNKNFRSKAEIVDFNNKFFRFISTGLDVSHIKNYESLEQEFSPENSGGYVAVEFLKSADENFSALNFSKTFSRIAEATASAYEYGDIAILCRSNEEASVTANFLSQNKIPVISSEALLLKNSPEVNFLESFFRLLSNSSDIISRVAFVNYLEKSGKIKHASEHHGSLRKFFENLKRNGIEINLNHLLKISLAELGEESARIFGLHRKQNLFVEFFLDELLKYSSRFGNNLSEFLEWWEGQKEKSSLAIPENMNAVRVMTIHKAKGLEFPVVILPFANWDFRKRSHVWIEPGMSEFPKLKSALLPVNKQVKETDFADAYSEEKNKTLLDNINLLYVAMTRAVDRLHIFTSSPPKNVSNFFADYFKNINRENESGFFETGAKTNNQKKKTGASDEDQFFISTFHSENWRNRIKIRQDSSRVWDTETGNEAVKKGITLHYALSLIETDEDIPSAFEKLISEGIINEAEQSTLEDKIKSLLAARGIKKFFSKQYTIKKEAEILDENGESYRPDRVMIENGKAVVMDFKTGKRNKTHEAQLRKYASLLSQMGCTDIEKFILYTEEEVLQSVE